MFGQSLAMIQYHPCSEVNQTFRLSGTLFPRDFANANSIQM